MPNWRHPKMGGTTLGWFSQRFYVGRTSSKESWVNTATARIGGGERNMSGSKHFESHSERNSNILVRCRRRNRFGLGARGGRDNGRGVAWVALTPFGVTQRVLEEPELGLQRLTARTLNSSWIRPDSQRHMPSKF